MMPSHADVRFAATILRKSPDLPRYVEVPADVVGPLGLIGTSPVEVSLNGADIGRRNLKPWGGERDVWFFDVTRPQCDLAGVETGDRVEILIRAASTEPPAELSDLVRLNATARRTWEGMTESQRRMLADHVRAATRSETRSRRAEKALIG